MFPVQKSPLRHLATAAVLACVCATPSALGVMTITFQKGQFQTGSGGEFVAITSPSFIGNYDPVALQTVDGQTGFSTFCLERNENIHFNVAYSGELNDRAIDGGVDHNETPNLAGDPLSLGAAWLYLLFSDGDLPNYAYGTAPYSGSEKTDRKADAGLLQQALWMLEDELTPNLSNYYVDLAADHFGSLSAAQSANNGLLPVGIINVSQGNLKRQDVLVRLASIPDGANMLGLLGLGLAGLALSRRLRKPAA